MDFAELGFAPAQHQLASSLRVDGLLFADRRDESGKMAFAELASWRGRLAAISLVGEVEKGRGCGSQL